MAENTAYEITFNREGFFGRKHLLYREDEDDQSADGSPTPNTTGTDEAAQVSGTAADPAATPDEEKSEIVAEFKMPEEMTCQIQFWGSNQWVEPGGDFGTTQWVFQSSGLCNPIRVQFRKGDSWIEVAFNPLTADIQEERYFFAN